MRIISYLKTLQRVRMDKSLLSAELHYSLLNERLWDGYNRYNF